MTEAIHGSGADVVFVCLGAPKQEKWMRKNGEATGAHLLVGLGDAWTCFPARSSGAPEVFQRLGLEWLHRLAKNPSRIGRMMKLPLFLVHVGAERGKTKMRGKLIVFEGTDGSGKATQTRLMARRLASEGVPFQEIDFPRYGKPLRRAGRLYLAGAPGGQAGGRERLCRVGALRRGPLCLL